MHAQEVLFAPRFLEKYVGKSILSEPKVAIMELIANSWDAGARKVEIQWPNYREEKLFSITDDGLGMTEDELNHRWRQLAYNRLSEQGEFIDFNGISKRRVFGNNGVGRFAGFCFGDNYYIETSANGEKITYQVKNSSEENIPFILEKVKNDTSQKHGTKIYTTELSGVKIDAESIRAEIGMRFLTDPMFEVYVDNKKVTFSDISSQNIKEKSLVIDDENSIKILIIDTKESDKTTKLHGIAWHVNNRLVGECSWQNSKIDFDRMIDGRRNEAKRYTFIVIADCLNDSVLPDWTSFQQNDFVNLVEEKVYKAIHEHILDLTKEKRQDVLQKATNENYVNLNKLTDLKKEKWTSFVNEVQEKCPTISDKDVVKLAGIMANLELSESKYKLISLLHDMQPNQLDNLHELLDDWSIDYAKEVLDELKIRLKLLDELKVKVEDPNTDEVQELQPLFQKGLWIFGPEFETIEYTSNEGMTNVVQKLYNSTMMASRNRPDFAILPDSTVGLYSYASYDDEYAENGTDKLVIVELKKPTVNIGSEEKSQCWKYVSELYEKGFLQDNSTVKCFVLGSKIKHIEASRRTENNGKVDIIPLTYSTIIDRAKSRVLKLYDKVKNAPFLQE